MKIKTAKRNARLAYWATPTEKEQVQALRTVKTKIDRCSSLKDLQRLAADYEVPGRSKWRNSSFWDVAVKSIVDLAMDFEAKVLVSLRSH